MARDSKIKIVYVDPVSAPKPVLTWPELGPLEMFAPEDDLDALYMRTEGGYVCLKALPYSAPFGWMPGRIYDADATPTKYSPVRRIDGVTLNVPRETP